MSFKDYVKSKIKYVFGVATIATLISQLIFPALSTSATEPRFNFLPGDSEMIRGKNDTQNESVWKNPVSGVEGEDFRGIVYYHNGKVDTTARNTKIKVSIPESTANKSAKITGSISADNAETVTSTVVDGQIVGHDGLIVNLDKDTKLEFVPGSVKWFPSGSQTPVAFPAGQTGNEIVSANGVNIGDINGCWEYAGYVTFGFKSIKEIVPETSVAISKTVKNDTLGGSFIEKVDARVGDIVTYNIDVNTQSNVNLPTVTLKDTLPSQVTYKSGSLVKIVSGVVTPLSDVQAGSLFGAGLNIGPVNAGSNKTTIQFKANVVSTALNCFLNTALVTVSDKSDSDTAQVCIVAPNIVKHKSAFNITKNEAAKVANASDVIEYTLLTQNTGSASIANFVVEDDISNVLRYSTIVSISDNGQIVTSGNTKTVRWSPVTINSGGSVTRKFTVKVVASLPATPESLAMINVYGDEVNIPIVRPVVAPVMAISKYVRNVTSNETNFVKSNQALAGDTLEYRINYSNTGTVSVAVVKIFDQLPVNTSYVAGSSVLSRNSGAEVAIVDGVTAGGVYLNNVLVGESGYIRFKVTTSSGLAVGQSLLNTGFLTYGSKTISDTAITKTVAKVVAVKGTSLPQTGPSAAAASSFIVSFLMGISFLYLRYRKQVIAPENAMISDLLAN